MVSFRITVVLNFVHRPEFLAVENTTFRKRDLFPSSGERKYKRQQTAAARSVYFACGLKAKENGVFWVVTPCGSCTKRRFGGT
jgi:hypothetical protein